MEPSSLYSNTGHWKRERHFASSKMLGITRIVKLSGNMHQKRPEVYSNKFPIEKNKLKCFYERNSEWKRYVKGVNKMATLALGDVAIKTRTILHFH